MRRVPKRIPKRGIMYFNLAQHSCFGTHKKLYTSFVGLDTPQFGRGSWLLEPLKSKKRL